MYTSLAEHLLAFLSLKHLKPLHSLLLKNFESFKHKYFRLVYANRLDVELKLVFKFTKVDLVGEFLMADTLSTRSAFCCIKNSSFFVDIFYINAENAHWTEFLQLFRIITCDVLSELNMRNKSVEGCAHGRPLSMCLTNTLLCD